MSDKREHLSFSVRVADQLNTDNDYKKIAQIEKEVFKKKFNIYFSDDKYWPKRDTKKRIREIKIYQELKHFERSYQNWLDFHLENGFPTFYSVLGANFNVNMNRLHEIYKFKKENSYIPIDIIEEAYKTIKKTEIRSKYNRFLKMFRNYYNSLDEEERSELDVKHSEWQYYEKKKIIMSLILERHKNWEILYLIGINLFSISKIKSNCKMQDIIALCEKSFKDTTKRGKILAYITQTFLNSFVYQEYRTFLSIFPSFFLKKEKNLVAIKLQKHWQKINFTINDFRDILLSEEPLMDKINTYKSILSTNNDWLNYLPPHKKTLYQVLDIDIVNLNSNDSLELKNINSQFRDLLFKKYKNAQKSPETNLAYTTLKNPQIRANYDWMLKNNLVLMKIFFLLQIKDLGNEYLEQILKGNRCIEDILIQFFLGH